ncbi:MAG: phosphoadenylyl-sulfate reductase [Akkermansiaceae bacterium]
MSTLTKDAEAVAAHLESMRAGERIAWLHETFGNRVVASSSFGLQAAVMLHLISENAPEIPVVFIDTGYLFPETYRYIEELSSSLKVNLHHYVPKMTAAHQESLHGKLWNSDPKEYARINKVEPMNRALKEIGGDIWLSGLRWSQSSTRSERGFSEQQGKTMKVYPILDWADSQVASYFHTYALPQHPLSKEGYVTMGDWHSTRKPETGESSESTRFNGAKYECGLHEESGHLDFQI